MCSSDLMEVKNFLSKMAPCFEIGLAAGLLASAERIVLPLFIGATLLGVWLGANLFGRNKN